MLMTFVLFTLVIIATTEKTGKLYEKNDEDGWKEELKFWGKTTCRAGRRRIFSLHEIPKNDRSRRLHDFFGNLVSGVQLKCGATMVTKSYSTLNYTYNPTYYDLFEGDNDDEIIKNPPIYIEKIDDLAKVSSDSDTHLFPFMDVEILVMLMDDCIRILMNGSVLKNWDNRRHVIVLMITKKNMTTETSKLLSNTFVTLLQKLWKEHRVLNIFFAAPFSTFGRLIWFFDPFNKNETSGVRGKIFALRVSSIPNVQRVTNLQGFRLNIGMFETLPAAIKYCRKCNGDYPFAQGSHGFVGIDGLTMTEIAKRMNFEYNIVPPTDGVEFGHGDENGTLAGTIGDAAYHKIDIGFNSMFIKSYTPGHAESAYIEFTTPIDFDRMCVAVPRALKIPRWLRTFHYFDPAIWASLVITQFVVALAWFIVRKCKYSRRRNFDRFDSSIGNYLSLLVTTFILCIGAPINNLRLSSQVEKLIIVVLLLFGITIMGTFTGTLYHSFTNEMHYKEISSLKELDLRGIPVATGSLNLMDAFGPEETRDDYPEIMSLKKKLTVLKYDGSATIEKTAYKRNVASLSREHSFLVTKHRYVDDTGASLVHLIRDCPRSYYLAYVVPKDSVYLERFNNLVRHLLEAGLPPLWNSVTTHKLIIDVTAKTNFSRQANVRAPFNIRDMQTSFILLGIGHLLAICVLIGEIIYSKKQRATRRIEKIGHRDLESRRNIVDIVEAKIILEYDDPRIGRIKSLR